MFKSMGGREGDWSCSECGNLNYSFRSACNRCKQPKVAPGAHTQTQSKWFPRAGDWICNGCRNNNYAFRKECNKCGEPRDLFDFPPDGPARSVQIGEMARTRRPDLDVSWGSGNGALGGGPGANGSWQSTEWVCSCGFMNFSFDSRCKQCHMPLLPLLPAEPYPAPGMKRGAAEYEIDDWMRKRPNVGEFETDSFLMPKNSAYESWQQAEDLSFTNGGSDFQVSRPGGPMPAFKQPALPGRGLKHWREGDWICQSCENHNYASRKFCNRCMSQKDANGKLRTVY